MPRSTSLRSAPLLSLLLATLFPLHAEAAKWVALDSRGGARIEVDAASLDRSGDKLRVWHRESYAKPQIPDSGAFSFGSLTELTEFHCAKRLAAPLKRSYFAANGSELKTETYDGKEASPVAPDTVIESVFSFACKQRGNTPAVPVAKAIVPEPPAPPALPPTETRAPQKKGKSGAKDEPPAHGAEVHWTYEGQTGAGKWAKLSGEFAACEIGPRQSPIDIRETIRADLPPIRFIYKPVALSIIDNGHTIQVNTAGAGGISVDGEDYELLQFHFHKPSEEKINGKAYDMVAHLVHKSKAGKLAVVAVMLEAGKEQKLVRTLWNNLPLEQNQPVTKSEINIDPAALLPATRDYFTYTGSLTTPPCSEGVLWLVLKTPTQVSKEQVAGFGKIYRNNARPIQPGNGRIIKESR